MKDKGVRISELHGLLTRANEARRLVTTDVWAKAWESFERELLERLLKCEADDDVVRYRLQVAIECGRHVKRAVENEGQTVEGLETELDHLEGRKIARIA